MHDAEQTPQWCPRIHSEEQRPRYASGLINVYACCDHQIEMGARPATKCDPVCPWQTGTHAVREVWELLTMCLTTWEEGKERRTRYGLDLQRFEFALKVWQIPIREWKAGWQLAALVIHALNDPAFELQE